MIVTILGNVPSQKNRKIISRNSKTGASFLRSAPEVKEWQEDAARQLATQCKGLRVTSYPVSIVVTFFFGSQRRHDLDNALSTVMDALAAPREFELVDGKKKGIKGTGFIFDDSVDYINCITVQYGGYDKSNPRCDIYIDD
jgi:Holliday junction resolvase RusA-like endonuclease